MTRFQALRSFVGRISTVVHSATYLRKCQESYHIRPQKPVMQLTTKACRMGPGADIAIIDRLTVRRKNATRSHAPCVRLVWQDHRREHAAEGGAAWQEGREVWERWRATCCEIRAGASVSRQRLVRRTLLLGTGVAAFGRARKARTCMACRWPLSKEFVSLPRDLWLYPGH